MTTSHIDRSRNKDVATDIYIDRTDGGKKVVVSDTQDVDPILRHNAAMRAQGTTKGNDNTTHFREIADIPVVVARDWYNRYGLFLGSPAKSNWGMGMDRASYQRLLRSLLNANPALKTVDERL